jgi:phosphate-selective porin OprO/OprP
MKNIKTIMAASMAMMVATPTYAGSEIETLFNMLKQNGMVTETQYQRLMAELNATKAKNAALEKQLEQQLAEAKNTNNVAVKFDKGAISLKSRDNKFSTKLGGRVQADAAGYSDDAGQGNGTEIRRARLYLQGTMYHDWGYKLQYDFVSTGNKGIKDAFVTYKGLDDITLKLGNFKDPFSLQEQTSSKFVSFTERSLTTAFAAGRHIGFMANTANKDWTLAAGVFGDSVSKKGGSKDEDWGLGARATWSPINTKTNVLHLGLAANYRDTQSVGSVQFKTQPETHVAGINIVDTGTISDVDNVLKLGAEVAYVNGPFSSQAEYINTDVNRSSADDLEFDAWYVQAGYFFTGESRNYKKGKFGGVTPKSIVGEGGIGAWELALRYSSIDLSDSDIDGGEADAMTLGLNWFATPSLRFSANYVDVLDVNGGSLNNSEPSLFQVRSQWAF